MYASHGTRPGIHEKSNALRHDRNAKAWLQLGDRDSGRTFVIQLLPEQGFIYPINHTIEFQFIDIKAIDIFDSQYPYTFESCSKAHFTYFDRKQHALEKTILHDVYDFETILRELKIDQGEACVALNNSTPVGMAFAKKCSQDVILIKQIFSDNQTIHAALQKYACRLFETHHVKTILPATSTKEAIPYGLACIIDNQNHNLNNTCMSLMLD